MPMLDDQEEEGKVEVGEASLSTDHENDSDGEKAMKYKHAVKKGRYYVQR